MSLAFAATAELRAREADLVRRTLAAALRLCGLAEAQGLAAPTRQAKVLAAAALQRSGLMTGMASARLCMVGKAQALAPSQWGAAHVTPEMVEALVEEIKAEQPEPLQSAPAPAKPPKTPFRAGKRAAPKRSDLRRFASAEISPEDVIDLRADHPAITEGRTLFPSTVVGARQSLRLLVSGHNNPKLGREITKGERAGWPIFHLTLEERATCPASCAQWRARYGNAMHMARRHRADAELMAVLKLEVAAIAKQYPGGFLVRLHTLGDFFSPEYVYLWAELLAAHPQLHVFGYTARRIDSSEPESRKIAQAIAVLTDGLWSRFAIRTSHPEAGPQRSVVVLQDPERDDVIVCPAQTKATECCGSCGLCWSPNARDKTIAFLKHGMKRGARGRRPVAPHGEDRQDPSEIRQDPPSTGNASPFTDAERARGHIAREAKLAAIREEQDAKMLAAIAGHLRGGELTASLAELAAFASVPMGSVVPITRRLAEAGRLIVVKNPKGPGRQPPNSYRLPASEIPRAPPRRCPPNRTATRSLEEDCATLEAALPEIFRAHPEGATVEQIAALTGLPASACPRIAQHLYAEHKARWVSVEETARLGGRPRKVLRPWRVHEPLAELEVEPKPRPRAGRPLIPSVAERVRGLERLKPINSEIVRWSRAYAARGVKVPFLAGLFDVDADELAAALEAPNA